MKIFLSLKKQLLFCASFAFLFFTTFSIYAQLSYSVSAQPGSIRICGTGTTLTVTVSNPDTVSHSASEVQLSFSYIPGGGGAATDQGVFISDPESASAAVSFPGFTNHTSLLPLQISELASGDTISITMQIRAGCQTNIGFETSLNVSALINNVSLASFEVLRSQNGTLNPAFTQHPSWNQAAQKNQLVTRSMIYVNSTGSPFTGYIRFQDNLGSLLESHSIRVTLSDTVIEFSGTNFFHLPVNNIAPGETVLIEETVRVTDCIFVGEDGKSDVTVTTGCYEPELCNSQGFTFTVQKDQSIPVITTQSQPTWQSYFKCFGDTSFTERQATFTNANTGSYAGNVNIVFFPATATIADPSSFRISISGGTRDPIYGNFYRNPQDTISYMDPLVQGGSLHGPRNSNIPDDISFVRDLIGPSTRYACNEENFLWSRLINSFTDDSTDQIHTIDLYPGETITIYWRDKSCCLDQAEILRNGHFNTPTIRFYSPTCDQPLTPLSSYYSIDYYDGFQVIDPFTPMISGNPDKCILTNDGEIREFTIRNMQSLVLPSSIPADTSGWGSYVMELSIEPGLDLDLSLGGTGLAESYNDACATDANCDADCAEAQPLWNLPQYRARFVHPQHGVWTGTVTKLPGSGNLKKYRITFDLNTMPGDPVNAAEISLLLKEMRFEYSLRAYCGGGPKTGVSARFFYEPLCNTGCMLPLSALNYHMVVICPGCITPGANVTSAVFERHTDYLGFKDDNNDRIPDSDTLVSGILRTNCTNGDLMVSDLLIELSDGDRAKGGFKLVDLPADNRLDNIYIHYNIDTTLLEWAGGILQARLPATETWTDLGIAPVISADEIVFQIEASTLSITDFHSNRQVFFRTHFRVKPGIQEEQPMQTYIAYTPYFSDCDTCGGVYSDFAGKFSCDWSDTLIGDACKYCTNLNEDTCGNYQHWQSDMGYFCQGGESLITIYSGPLLRVHPGTPHGDFPCSPAFRYDVVVEAGRISGMPNEYRRWRFIEDHDSTFTFRQHIPEGYEVTRIEFLSQPENIIGYGFLDREDFDSVSGVNIEGDSLLTVSVSFRYQGFGQSYSSTSYQYQGASFPVYDDYLGFGLRVYMQPLDCMTLTGDSINAIMYLHQDHISSAAASHPTVRFVPLPFVDLPPLAGNPAGSYSWNGFMTFNKPVTRLEAISETEAVITRQRYYLPLWFDNGAPVDANGIVLKGFDNIPLPSIDARYPFIYFTNLEALAAEGIFVRAVYENEVNASTPNPGENFFDDSSGIARLEHDGQQHIQKNTSQKRYTVELEYTCPDNCNPFLAHCGVPDSQFPSCVIQPKFLLMQYGWDCEGYPSDEAEAANSCFIRDMDTVHIRTSPVALSFSASLSSDTVQLCEPFDYILNLKSCMSGNITMLNTRIVLPEGFTYLGNSHGLDTLTNGNEISFGDILPAFDLEEFSQEDSVITIHLRVNSLLNAENRNILLLLDGETYCGSEFARSDTTPVVIDEVLSGLRLTTGHTAEYCPTEPPVTISPEISGGVFTFVVLSGTPQDSAFVINNDGSATFDPALAGVGTYSITYTLSDTCFAEYEIIVRDGITADAGTDTTLCSSASVQLGTAPQPGFTYQWTPSTGLSSDNIANPIASPLATTTYALLVSDTLSGCIGRDSVTITIVNIQAFAGTDTTLCSGNTVQLGAPAQPGLTYSWTPAGGLSDSTASNPVATVFLSTDYILTVTDSLTGCTARDTVSLMTGDCCPIGEQLVITFTEAPSLAYLNGTVTFEITVTNNTAGTIEDFMFTDLLSTGAFAPSILFFANGQTFLPGDSLTLLPFSSTVIRVVGQYTVLTMPRRFDQCFSWQIPSCDLSDLLCTRTVTVIGCPASMSGTTVDCNTTGLPLPIQTCYSIHNSRFDINRIEFTVLYNPSYLSPNITTYSLHPVIPPGAQVTLSNLASGQLYVNLQFPTKIDFTANNGQPPFDPLIPINEAPICLNFTMHTFPECATLIENINNKFYQVTDNFQPLDTTFIPTDYGIVSVEGIACGCDNLPNANFTLSHETAQTGQFVNFIAEDTTGISLWYINEAQLGTSAKTVSYKFNAPGVYDVKHTVMAGTMVASAIRQVTVNPDPCTYPFTLEAFRFFPANKQDGVKTFPAPVYFRIPAEIFISEGEPRKGSVELSFLHEGKNFTCRYRHSAGRFLFFSSTGGSTFVPGALKRSSQFRLSIENAAPFPPLSQQQNLAVYVTITPEGCVGNTAARMSMEEEAYNEAETEAGLLIYPNPYQGETSIVYELKEEQHVQINVYNSQGGKVAEIVNGWQQPGVYEHKFSAREKGYSSGIYLLEAIIDNRRKLYKLIEIN